MLFSTTVQFYLARGMRENYDSKVLSVSCVARRCNNVERVGTRELRRGETGVSYLALKSASTRGSCLASTVPGTWPSLERALRRSKSE